MVELKKSCVKDCAFEIYFNGKNVGEIEYKNFWEGMPYLSLMRIKEEYRGKGIGTAAILLFEKTLKSSGEKAILVSTRVDELAQRFYRKAGYAECGALILENTPFSQPMEMFFIKSL